MREREGGRINGIVLENGSVLHGSPERPPHGGDGEPIRRSDHVSRVRHGFWTRTVAGHNGYDFPMERRMRLHRHTTDLSLFRNGVKKKIRHRARGGAMTRSGAQF